MAQTRGVGRVGYSLFDCTDPRHEAAYSIDNTDDLSGCMRHRNNGGDNVLPATFEDGNKKINEYAQSHGIPASTCILLALVSQFVFPNTFLFVFFYLVCGRFYTNSLLVTLNGRQYIIEGTMARISFNVPRGNRKNPQPRGIRKTTTSVPMVTLTLGTRDKKSDKPVEGNDNKGLSSSTSTSSALADNQV
ncbi:hypothetical protein PQX77_009324 [Marasmius sp. AFHP31]|nr:hypothetical protein PQX77_009324 [Marasmius sp. AFHP31]